MSAGCIQQAGQAKCKDCKRGPRSAHCHLLVVVIDTGNMHIIQLP
jgi:hypothetical protein